MRYSSIGMLLVVLLGMLIETTASAQPIPDMTQGTFKTDLTNILTSLKAGSGGGSTVINVKSYGALSDDTLPVSPAGSGFGSALKAAIAAAVAQGGGVVYVPCGTYKWGTSASLEAVVLPAAVRVVAGCPWQPITSYWNGVRGPAAWMHITSTAYVPITLDGGGNGIEGLAFFHDQPTPGGGWAPTAYPFTIEIAGTSGNGDNTIRDILFLNATRGIHQLLGTWPGGQRLTVERVYGQVFQVGIQIDSARDVERFSNVNFWPYWSIDTNVRDYTQQNMTGILCFRCDTPTFTNIFVIYASYGIHFAVGSDGLTTEATLTNVAIDGSKFGLVMDGGGTAYASNLNIINCVPPGEPSCVGSQSIVINGGAKLIATNVLMAGAALSCAQAVGSGTRLTLDQYRCRDWNRGGSTAGGLQADVNALILTGPNAEFAGGMGGKRFGTSTGGISGKMAIGGDDSFYMTMDEANHYSIIHWHVGTGDPVLFYDQSTDFLRYLTNAGRQGLAISGAGVLGLDPTQYATGGVNKPLCTNNGQVFVGPC
jgi:hypothetical protein